MSALRGLAAAVAATALAMILPLLPAAAVSTGGDGAFGLTPAPDSNGNAPPYFTMNLAAGHSATFTALLRNLAPATEKLKVSRVTGITAANGGSAFSRAFRRCSGTGCWVTGLPATVTLPAGEAEKLTFTVRVPHGTAAGQYLAGITAELAHRPRPTRVGSNGKANAQAVIIRQVTVGVAVTVGPRSALRTHLVISGVSGRAIEHTARLEIRLGNTGQTFTHGAGQASCAADARRHSFPVSAATLLPHGRAVIAVNAPGLPEGVTMPCVVRLRYGHGLTARWAGLVTVPAPPRERIVHTGPGAYSVVPDSGIPPWAIALIVLGVLILAALALLLLRMRRQLRTPSS